MSQDLDAQLYNKENTADFLNIRPVEEIGLGVPDFAMAETQIREDHLEVQNYVADCFDYQSSYKGRRLLWKLSQSINAAQIALYEEGCDPAMFRHKDFIVSGAASVIKSGMKKFAELSMTNKQSKKTAAVRFDETETARRLGLACERLGLILDRSVTYKDEGIATLGNQTMADLGKSWADNAARIYQTDPQRAISFLENRPNRLTQESLYGGDQTYADIMSADEPAIQIAALKQRAHSNQFAEKLQARADKLGVFGRGVNFVERRARKLQQGMGAAFGA